ncbi:hypothetical protein VD0002_g473 [Verticillium dahliae]|nr:hypothetical protein VD0003_g968 [Verticillium dahliae]PNH70082.1 hypothetical protein VD0002_g473 [Verticillium dahliae]
MPLANVGSLVLWHVIFLTHLVHISLFFRYTEPEFLIPLYIVVKVLGYRPDNLDAPAQAWPPHVPKWYNM